MIYFTKKVNMVQLVYTNTIEGENHMKKKILYILVAALLYILTQVPTIVSNYKFEAGIWDIELCRYVLMSVGWMIVILYVIHFVLDYIKNMGDE